MDSAVILGLAGLSTTGGTAVWLRWLEDRRHTRQLTHDRAMRDSTELRALLDEASVLIRRTMWQVLRILEAFRASNLGGVREGTVSLRSLTEESSLMVGRISLRLGASHRVTRAYDDLIEIYVRMNTRMNEALPVGVSRYTTGRKALTEGLDVLFDETDREFTAARNRFISAASELVGVDIAALASIGRAAADKSTARPD